MGANILREKVEASFLRQDIVEEIGNLRDFTDSYNYTVKSLKKNGMIEDAEKYKGYIRLNKDKEKELRKQLKELDKKWGNKILPLTDYETDAMWMSYRYAIGRHTIASHYHTKGIFENCYGRESKERTSFIAYDINREIENSMIWGGHPSFYFQLTNANKVYKSAIDAYCEFIEQEGITTYEELESYEKVNVNYELRVDEEGRHMDVFITPEKREGEYEKNQYFTISNFEDLFVWNDLVHIFDLESHKKCRLKDGTVVEYFWTWAKDYKEKEDGTRQEVCYKKIRVPLYEWNPVTTIWIPDEAIVEDNIED